GFTRAVGAGSTDPFRGTDRHHVGDRLRGRTRPEHRRAAAGTVRARQPSVDCERRGAAGARTVVAGAAAGAGDARSARLLAWQLCRRAVRPARPLPPAPLAGGSGQRRPDAAGQTARNLNTAAVHARVNTSLILFAKMAASAGVVSRGLAGVVVIFDCFVSDVASCVI